MKYTKNIHNKLLLAGFKQIEEVEELEEPEYLNYIIYKKGCLDVTVSDSHKNIDINLDAEFCSLPLKSFGDLITLDKLIN